MSEKIPNQSQENDEKEESQIITPSFESTGRMSEEIIKESKQFLKNEDDIKDIKEKQKQGESLSSIKTASLREDEMKRNKEEEIIELTDVVEREGNNNEETSESENDKNTDEHEPTENTQEQQEQNGPWANLETARTEYIERYQEFLRGGRLARLRNALGLTPAGGKEMPLELIETRERYNQAKKTYAQDEWETSLEKISPDLSEEKRAQTEAEIINRIYNIAVLDESDYLEEARIDAFSPFQKGLLVDAYQRWTSLNKSQRIIASTVMVAGVAGFASLAVPVTASAAAIGIGGVAGKKILRGTFGVLMSGLTGKAYDKFTQGKKERVEQTATDTTETARESFNINNLTAISERYKNAIKQEQQGNRNIMFGKIATMGAAGIGSTVGFGLIGNAFGEGSSNIEDKTKLGFQKTPQGETVTIPAEPVESKAVESAKKALEIAQENKVTPEEKTALLKGLEKDYPREVEEADDVYLTRVKEAFNTEIEKNVPPVETTTLENASADTIEPEDIIKEDYSIKSGDNLWNILKKELPEIAELEKSGMKDNVVANLIEKIKENPTEYGITSDKVDSLKIGDQINMEKIHELLESEKIDGKSLVEHATQDLTKKQLSDIENFKLKAEVLTNNEPSTERPVSPPNTTGADLPSPETVNLNETLNNIYKTETELDKAKSQLEEMKDTATDTLTNDLENHETQMHSNANVDAQEKVVADMEDQLTETKNYLSEAQKKFESMLLEADKTYNRNLEVTAKLGLAEITFTEGNEVEALKFFESATHSASHLNGTDRIIAFTDIASKEAGYGFIDKATENFGFAENEIMGGSGMIDNTQKPAALLNLAEKEAQAGLNVEAKRILNLAEAWYDQQGYNDTQSFNEAYSNAIIKIENTIKNN
ncbi:MAG: hypothetical protein U9P50_01875 [Patescibacteria group bacterium]|nr:hypothetical protein [Patescibacteria group bacterium]